MYDTIIIGGGFAGLSAAIYAARYDLKTLVLAQEMGGTITESAEIENYPGYKSISGYDLMKKFEDQVLPIHSFIHAEFREVEIVQQDVAYPGVQEIEFRHPGQFFSEVDVKGADFFCLEGFFNDVKIILHGRK